MKATRSPLRRRTALRISASLGLVASAALIGVVGPAGRATGATAATTLTWSTYTASTSPPPLSTATAVYDSDNKTVVLFGGERANGALSNDTWVWNGSTWIDYPGTAIQAPPARRLASMAFDPKLHQLILFGGQGANGLLLGDTWAWNGASWYEKSTGLDSEAPTPREAAAMAYDADGELMLFGGTGHASQSASPSTTTVPTTTTLPSAGTANGGVSTASTSAPLVNLSDTWRWNGASWVQGRVTGPAARAGAAIAYDSSTGQTLLFGGQSSAIGTPRPALLSDTWAWNGSLWTLWVPPAGKSIPWPAPRAGANLAGDPLARGLVLFGGTTSRGLTADTWLWTGTGWESIQAKGGIGARAQAAAAFDAGTTQLVVFGGEGAGGVIFGDTVLLGRAPVALNTGPTTTLPSRLTPPPPSGSRARPSTSTTVPVSVGPVGPPAGVSAPAAPPVLHPGDLVKLLGTGFKAESLVTITFHSVPMVVGQARTDASGDFIATVAVPDSAAAGTHHFEATGPGQKGPIAELLATVDVQILHRLGSSTSLAEKLALVGVAVAMPVGTWLALVGAGWWRRRPHIPAG